MPSIKFPMCALPSTDKREPWACPHKVWFRAEFWPPKLPALSTPWVPLEFLPHCSPPQPPQWGGGIIPVHAFLGDLLEAICHSLFKLPAKEGSEKTL